MKIFNQSNELLAILDNIINSQISEEINGEYSLSFTTVIEEEKSQYIHYNNYIEVEDDNFQIVKYKKIRNSNNELLIDVLAEHKSYELNDYELDEFVYSGTTTATLNYLLNGTPYSLLTCDITTIISIEIREKTNKRSILMEIAKVAAGELEFNKFNISLLQQRGENRGVYFKVGKNLQGISVDIDNTIKILGLPTITYDVDIAELNELEDFHGYELIKTGDTIKVIDEDLGINADLRIKSYSKNPFNRIESNINITNIVKNITDDIVNIKREAVYKDIVYNGNVISPEVGFQSTRSDLKARSTMSGTVGFLIESGDGTGNVWSDIFSVDASGEAILEGRQQITSGGNLLIENTKNDNGGVTRIYDIDGNLNIAIGSERGTAGRNTGGTIVLLNDAGVNQRIAMSTDKDFDCGYIALMTDVEKVRISFEADSTLGPIIIIRDNTGVAKTYFTELQGVINGETIATQQWVVDNFQPLP